MVKVYNLMHDKDFAIHNRTIIIGNFDGVHLGHKFLISEAEKIAAKTNTMLSALTFIPHSSMILYPGRIYNLFDENDKYKELFASGIKDIFVVKNDPEFFNLSAKEFVENILITKLKCSNIVVGKDFRFGKNRAGNLELLKFYENKGYFSVKLIDSNLSLVNNVISSTNIRNFLQEANIEAASKLLGYPYFITGTVIEGQKIATSLGYPTANLDISKIFTPKYGVYSALMEYNHKVYQGVINSGITPNFRQDMPKLEMYIFDFAENLYGKTIKIFPQRYQREEMRFSKIEELIEQMRIDCEIARDYFRKTL